MEVGSHEDLAGEFRCVGSIFFNEVVGICFVIWVSSNVFKFKYFLFNYFATNNQSLASQIILFEPLELLLILKVVSYCYTAVCHFSGRKRSICFRVVTNLENSGNLKNCQNLRENSGKFEFL